MPRYRTYGRLDTAQGDDGDTTFFKVNSRLRPDQLKAGEVAMSQNGRMDVDGAWQVRRGISVFGTPVVTGTQALFIPFYLYASKTISSAVRSTTTVTVTTSAAHGFTTNTLVGIQGLTGTISPNSNRLITVTGTTTFTFTIPGAAGSETYTGSGTAGAPLTDDTSINGVFGSCLYSDPHSNNDEYIVLATNNGLQMIQVKTGATTNIAYPSGVTISADVNLIQAFNYLFILRDGNTALQWNGDFTAPTMILVNNGTYTQPVIYQTTGNTVIASGVVTITATAHAVQIGDSVTISDIGTTDLNTLTDYVVFNKTTDTFQFRADAKNTVSGSPATIAVGKPQSVGLGYTTMPCPPWAIYHQRRLWMPFNYLSTGTSGNPTITSRNVSDEIIASDILDQNTYDQILNEYKISSGSADYLVALQPFAQDNLVAFGRNSIHLISGVTADLANSTVTEITREVGCCARKTVAQIGNQIVFLSDNGVYAVEFDQLYNLRGASVPLSQAINPSILNIDPTYITNAVGVYHDNRYYLAVTPIGSTQNNTILIYNFLNGGWESIDYINQDGWDIRNFVRAGSGGIHSLYAINKQGGIHLLDSGTQWQDKLALKVGEGIKTVSIDASLKTRQYTFSTIDRKKFNNFELHIESSPEIQSDVNLNLIIQNIDNTVDLGTVSYLTGSAIPAGEDESVRSRLGNLRGYGAQLYVNQTSGRPKVRAIKVGGMLSFSSTTSAQ